MTGTEPSTEKGGGAQVLLESGCGPALLGTPQRKVEGQLQLASHLLIELFNFPLLITSYHCYFFSTKM